MAIRNGIMAVMMGAILVAGCDESSRVVSDAHEKVREENTTLRMEVEQLQEENRELHKQVQSLAKLDADQRMEALSGLAKIDMTRRTGLYDKDDDGVKEKLIVYLRTYDDSGDLIKVAGRVTIQLWDLEGGGANALLGEWTIEPEDLKGMWASTFMTNYYRLTFDVLDMIPPGREELTVKAVFTDMLTGKVSRMQHVIEL